MMISSPQAYTSQVAYRPNYNTKAVAEDAGKVNAGAVQQSNLPDMSPVQQVSATANARQNQVSGNVPDDVGAWVNEQISTMASPATTQRITATSSSSANLYDFYNQYLYGTSNQTWANLDTGNKGYWDKNDLIAYADAYEQATGKTLDVDALYDEYKDTRIDENGNPVEGIFYADQQRMYEDDALGIAGVNKSIAEADRALKAGFNGDTKINDKALDDFVDKYTYGYPGKMWAKVDQNEDGVWSYNEFLDYISAYEKATGQKIDAEALFSKYDKNGNGFLTYSEQNDMYNDDALGLSNIKDALRARESGSGSETGSTDKDSSTSNDNFSNWLKDLAGTMSSSQLKSFSAGMAKSLEKQALLNAFEGYTNAMNFSRFGGFGYSGYNNSGIWAAHNFGILNMFV